MAVSPTYPGVYVQEVPSGVRTIVGVGTSTALFVGRTLTGPMFKAVRINTYSDFVSTFGDDAGAVSSMARYVRLFFLNGGTDCYVVRIANGSAKSVVTLENEAGAAVLTLRAKNAGELGDLIRAAVTYNTAAPDSTFNLEVFRWSIQPTGARSKVDREEFLNLSMDPDSPSYAVAALNQRSKLVEVPLPAPVPTAADGRSIGMAPLEATNANTMVSAFNAMRAAGSNFKISLGGKKIITCSVAAADSSVIAVATDFATARARIATVIQNAIQNAVTAEGITGLATPPATVTVLQGPAAVTAGSETAMVRITFNSTGLPATANRDVRCYSGDTGDLAKPLMLGLSNGGIEIGAFAASRPAPTGLTFRDTVGLDPTGTITAANVVSFGGALKSDLTGVTLDEVLTGTTATARALVFNPVLGAGTRVWRDDAGGTNGVLETLGKIRDRINSEQSANPATFFWRAELWGYRLALLNSGFDDNNIVAGTGTGAFAWAGAGAAAMLARWFQNVRYLSLGAAGNTNGSQQAGANGSSGTAPIGTDYTTAYNVVRSDVDLFNLMVLPPDAAPAVALETLWGEASAFCNEERAFLIMDPPQSWTDTQTASTGVNALRTGLTKDHAAVYFPRLKLIENGREYTVGPAGAMAGLYARIDANRGVWKAPAGTEADVRGVSGVDLLMSDLQNGAINPVGVNAIRSFPEGVISWGARTMDGADAFASEYKYVPIRRLAMFIEESLYRGLKWVVFEPNDEPLWAQIRLNVGAFMHDLFRKGAFQGVKPTDAYFVKCDKETTTFNDQNLGIVNIWVGFAPLKPAEFVVLYLQQIAQKLAT